MPPERLESPSPGRVDPKIPRNEITHTTQVPGYQEVASIGKEETELSPACSKNNIFNKLGVGASVSSNSKVTMGTAIETDYPFNPVYSGTCQTGQDYGAKINSPVPISTKDLEGRLAGLNSTDEYKECYISKISSNSYLVQFRILFSENKSSKTD